jgi:PAS domain S-box-containing protein
MVSPDIKPSTPYPDVADPTSTAEIGRETPRIALGITHRRNRELLEELLSTFDVTEVADPIPDRTDLCIVDATGLSEFREAITTWKRNERPATAPVLLLTTDSADDAWRRYGDSVGDLLDAIHPIPSPKEAIRSRVDGLLSTRHHSLVSRQRQQDLELYKRASDGAQVGISIADASDPDHPLIYVNDGFCDLTGYSSDEVIGRNCRFLQGEDTDEATVRKMRTALEAKRPVSVELRNYRKSGDMFWNDLDIMPVRDHDGEVTHFLGFQQDVTERKQRERLLEQYERVFQSAEDPAFILDKQGRIVKSNAAAEAAFGAGRAIPAGTPASRLFEGNAAAKFRATTAAVRDSGQSRTAELTTADPDGQRTVFQFRFQRLESTETFDERIIAISRDITRIREYQNRLSVLDRILRHNLRNKLNVVTGLSDFLSTGAETLADEEIVEMALDIGEAAESLLSLADAAREFNHSIDPMGSRTEVVELGAFVRDVGEDLRDTYPDADIDIQAAGTVTAVCPSSIRLCLKHMVQNAIEYTNDPEPWVCLEVEEGGDSRWVELRVSDNGPGFPERERQALTSGGEKPMEHLQGITLWLIRWAVMNSDGQLDIQDRPEGGTTVVLRLRAAESALPAEE